MRTSEKGENIEKLEEGMRRWEEAGEGDSGGMR